MAPAAVRVAAVSVLTSLSSATIGNGAGTGGRGQAGAADDASGGRVTENAEAKGFASDVRAADAVIVDAAPGGGADGWMKGSAPAGGRIGATAKPDKGSDGSDGLVTEGAGAALMCGIGT